MKCPFCSALDNKVIDSRLSKDHNVIRRRRECLDTLGKREPFPSRINDVELLQLKGRNHSIHRCGSLRGGRILDLHPPPFAAMQKEEVDFAAAVHTAKISLFVGNLQGVDQILQNKAFPGEP